MRYSADIILNDLTWIEESPSSPMNKHNCRPLFPMLDRIEKENLNSIKFFPFYLKTNYRTSCTNHNGYGNLITFKLDRSTLENI